MEHLIPQAWFAGLPQWALLSIGAVAVIALMKGADWLVGAASGAAYRLGIPKVIVGATVVSLGTTAPEAAVSVTAAWSGEPGLALGNGVGSIIADTGLIFGLGCLLAVLPADRFVLRRQGWVQFGAGTLLAVICYTAFFLHGDQAFLPRWIGFVLVALLLAYLFVSVRWSRARSLPGMPANPEAEARAEGGIDLMRLIPSGLAGLALVILASRVMVLAGTELAEVHWHVPKVVIAATLVALGTSLPELVIGVTSILRGHTDLLVGNVIGADILNVLFVVGASASAASLPIVEQGSTFPRVMLYLHLPTMILVLLLFRVYIHFATRRGTFRRWYGVPLVAIYVTYTAVQYLLS